MGESSDESDSDVDSNGEMVDLSESDVSESEESGDEITGSMVQQDGEEEGVDSNSDGDDNGESLQKKGHKKHRNKDKALVQDDTDDENSKKKKRKARKARKARKGKGNKGKKQDLNGDPDEILDSLAENGTNGVAAGTNDTDSDDDDL